MTPRRIGKFSSQLKYGTEWRADIDPLALELECVRNLGRWVFRDRQCGEGLSHHIKQCIRLLWPEMQWNRWCDLMCDEFCRGGRLAVFGPSSSWKSYVLSRCAQVIFYAFPGVDGVEQSGCTCIISSTTLAGLHKRVWDYVVSGHRAAKKRYPWLPGALIESKTMLLADEKDVEGRSYKNGIIGVACKKGGQWQGLEEYVGIKNRVFILLADECHFMPMGFLDALANLDSNGIVFTAMMGNLPNIHNPLGRAAEPKLGWETLPDTEKSRVYDTRWFNGRCVQLIGTDSPNLDYPEGEEPFPRMIGRSYIAQMAHNYGIESDKFNMFASGKVPKGSLDRTVFTKSQCIRFNAMDGVTWGHNKVKRGYCLDPAYSGVGGDRTPGAPFIIGQDVGGRWRFLLGRITIYRGSEDTSIRSHCDAIALQTKAECEQLGIPPECVFYDGTGRSELTSSFARLWSSAVRPIEFGGPATERPSFTGERWLEDGRGEKKAGEVKACRDVFDRFVSELWFAIRHCILADQMRGLTEELIDESCQRRWEMVRGAKYSIEPKDGERDGQPVGMKARGLRSPDLGDMLAVGLEGARQMGFPLGKHTTPEKQTDKGRFFRMLHEQAKERNEKGRLMVA